jgi:type VI secretion system protein ImpA
MPTPEILDFEPLLAPIDDNEVGVDLRSDGTLSAVYYQVRDARSAARSIERLAVREGDGFPGMLDEWRAVIPQATEVLTTKTKNLEIVAWLIEALFRRDGFAGLRDGYRLAREMIEKYWDDIYPLPDEEDGVATRIAALVGLNGEDGPGTLEEPLNNALVTEGSSHGPFRVWEFRQARDLSALGSEEERQKKIEAGSVSMEHFQTAVAETDLDFFRNLIDDIAAAQEEYDRFCAVIEEKCGDIPVSTSAIKNHLIQIQDDVRILTRDVLPMETDDAEDAEADGAGPAAAGGKKRQAGSAGGPISSRADAVRALIEISNFFVRTEPHSPVSYSLRQVARWAQMPLPRLLSELIQDTTARENYFRLVGISSVDDDNSTLIGQDPMEQVASQDDQVQTEGETGGE